ncbi:MAG: hypothetical protein DMG13_15710 [Acidobacteria bacterium]|nr:MAG: hypothetical protein DMG13_15710 [Acidobacteriota bacterium]
MSATMVHLLSKKEIDLRRYVTGLKHADLQGLFTEMWDAIRQVKLYAGQPRNAASTEALTLSQLALSIADHTEVESLRAESHRMMAYVLNADEQYDESISHYTKAIQFFEQENTGDKAARTRIGLIAALFMTGQYQTAIEEAQKADEWFRATGDEDGHARISANLGNLYHRLDQHSRAVEHHGTAVKIFRKLENREALAQCYLNLGDSLSVLDRFEESNRNFEKSRKLSQQLHLSELNVQARYNQAYLSFLRGRYSDAIHGFDQLREYFNAQGSRRHAALCDLDEAEIYLQLNLTGDALTLAKRAAGSFQQLAMRYEQAKALTFVGIALAHDQQGNEALQVFREAQQIFEREKNLYWAASLELYRAQVHFLVGRFWEARSLAASALEHFTELGIPSKRAMALVLLTRVGLELSCLEQASGYSEQILKLVQETPIPLHLFPCYSINAQVAEHRGDLDRAHEFFTLAAQEIEIHRSNLHQDELRVSHFKGKQQVYESLVRLAFRRGDPANHVFEAYNWCEHAKSRGLVDLLAQHMPAAPLQSDQSLLNRIRTLREELNSYYIRSESNASKAGVALRRGAEIDTKKKELANTLKELSKQDPDYASLQKVGIVSVEEVQRVLPEDSTLIEYFIARDEIMAFVISKDRVLIRRHICTRSRIQHLYERLRLQLDKFLIGNDYVREYSAQLLEATTDHLSSMYTELVEPLADALTTKHLIIVPHGVLHYCPFHAFFDGTNYLIDRYTISYAPSASVLRHCLERKPIENATPLLIGVPDENAPMITHEVKHLKKIFPQARSYFGRRATRRVFRREAAQAEFVHIATHAVFRHDNPIFSSFKLADGWMTALDVYSIQCQTNLLAISGCKSGISQLSGEEELLGLMRGFLYAGARSLLLSLWDVNDRTTSVFMQTFYQSWLNGLSKAEALRQAIQKVRAEEPHPYFWAPFLLVGNH